MRFLLLFASLSVSIIIAEFIIRVTDLAPEVVHIEKWRMQLSSNTQIGYEPVPNLDSRDKPLQLYSYHGISNNLGYRDKNWQAKKPEGTTRIVLLGDSVAEGLWIKNSADIFAHKLSSLLKESEQNVEVLNFAVSGYNTRQEVETLKDKALQFNPDYILLAYCLNDNKKDDGHIIEHLLAEKKEKSSLYNYEATPLAYKSHLYRFVRYQALPSLGYLQREESKEKFRHLSENSVPEAFSLLSQIASRNSLEVLIAIFPDFTNIDSRIYENEFSEEHRRIKNLALENNFEVIDLFKGFVACKQNNEERLLSFDRYHMRPLGHSCAAQILYHHLKVRLTK